MSLKLKGKGVSSQVIATDTTTYGDKFNVPHGTEELLIVLKVSSRTDGTFTPVIEHSHDGGANYETLKTGGGVTTNDTTYTTYSAKIDGPFLSILRIGVTSASTTSGATVEASIFYG